MRLADVDCGGKFGTDALVATRKWNLGGKQSGTARFATRINWEEPVAAWCLIIVVANLGLML